jgi:frataxin
MKLRFFPQVKMNFLFKPIFNTALINGRQSRLIENTLFIKRTFSIKRFDFNAVSEGCLNNLLEKLELKENLLPATFDAEYSQGVLTLKFDPKTVYVINKQPPNEQIWMSSPFSGPRRFEWNFSNETWRDVRNCEIELNEFLRKELKENLKFDL